MKIKVICKTCSKEFFKKPSEIRNGRGKYCSKKCVGRSFGAYLFNKGKKMSEEQKKKLSKYRTGMPSPTLGKRMAESTKKLLSDKAKIRNVGTGNPRWKGGISKNNDYHYVATQKRRAYKIKTGGYYTFAEWENLKAQYNWMCPSCHIFEPEIKLTQDHIIPLSKGGSNNIENIQPLCKSCNSRKYNKLIPAYLRGKEDEKRFSRFQ